MLAQSTAVFSPQNDGISRGFQVAIDVLNLANYGTHGTRVGAIYKNGKPRPYMFIVVYRV